MKRVINIPDRLIKKIKDHYVNPYEVDEICEAILNGTPQRPKGKWLDKKMTIKGAHGMAYGRYACSVCKKKFPNKSNYCPNCGAKMMEVNADGSN